MFTRVGVHDRQSRDDLIIGPAMPYEVHTPVFDGPFDLLLHLILREQVDLYEISLTGIVDAYLTELDRIERLDLEVATEFLLIAAALLELKTRRLLPDHSEIELDEELDHSDGRDLLLARLVECKTFKDAALVLRALLVRAARSYPRRCGPDERYSALVGELPASVTPDELRLACLRSAQPKPTARVDFSHITPIKVTVAETLEELASELPRLGRVTFRDLTGHLGNRIEAVVRFLAVLELFKRDLVDLEQTEAFGELTIVWIGPEPVPAGLSGRFSDCSPVDGG